MQHDNEPVRGLPQALPEGERILWQGSPDWRDLTWRAFFGRLAVIWFGVLMIWNAAAAWEQGAGAAEIVLAFTALAPVAAATIGILALLAYLTARTTIYTITNRRVVLRFGVAMTLCANTPFERIGSAALRPTGRGCGDIALALNGEDKFSYLLLWPHARPWRFNRPEPMLRSAPNAADVARILGEALAAAQAPAELSADAPTASQEPAPQRQPGAEPAAGAGAWRPAAAAPR